MSKRAVLRILALAIVATASAQTAAYQSQTANLGAVKIHYLKAGSGKMGSTKAKTLIS